MQLEPSGTRLAAQLLRHLVHRLPRHRPILARSNFDIMRSDIRLPQRSAAPCAAPAYAENPLFDGRSL